VGLIELGTKRLALPIALWLFFLGGLLVTEAQENGQLPAGSPESQEKSTALPPAEAPGATTDAEIVPGSEPSPAKLEAGPDYVIGPEDVLNIDVFNVPELSKFVVRVANDGKISLPLLGQVHASGFTTKELRSELEERWGESYLENPQLTVFVQEFRARPVSVMGAVDKPGLYQLVGPRTLVEVLAMAGGLAKRGSGSAGRALFVTRKGGFEDLPQVPGMRLVAPDKLQVDVHRLLYSQNDALNINIKPLDIISVTRADVVYVVGEVRKPGGFVLEDRDKITVLQALALAEGLNWSASKRGAEIIRRQEDGTRTEIRLDLGKILRGKASDVELAGNDILFVPVSKGKAAGGRSAQTAIGTITGLLIYGRW